MRRKHDILPAVRVASIVCAAIAALLPLAHDTADKAHAQRKTSCDDFALMLASTERYRDGFIRRIEMKSDPSKWKARLDLLNKAITGNYVLSDVNDIARSIDETIPKEIDLVNRQQFQLKVRDALASEISKANSWSDAELLDTKQRWQADVDEIVADAQRAGCTKIAAKPTPAPVPPFGKLIHVVSGTYGANCGVAEGNKTEPLASECNAKKSCVYTINHTVIGDPKYGCAKNYIAKWTCGYDTEVFTATVDPEAGRGGMVRLYCPN